ncbi:MAG: rhodanese-like domain-containing protein [Planctomycetaceae bacterium]
MNSPSEINPLEITCSEVKAKLDSREVFVLLDCREQVEFDFAHLEGAVFIPMSELTTRYEELAEHREQELVVYCHHGQRSLHVAHWLQNQGFTNVKSMNGGIDCWSLEIDPEIPRYQMG